MDSEGNTSEPSVQIISKDTQAPADVALTVTTYDKTSITVNATGTDDASGIISYAFQISQTENDDDFTTVETVPSTENSCAYTYTGLTLGTRYYLRVIVTDVAGYSTVSEIVKRSTQDNGLSDTQLSANIGKYVDYEPTIGSYTSSSTYNGSSTQNFSTNTGAQWRILFVDDTTITLISEEATNENFRMTGFNGYNNGVKLLNDACKAMYSNSALGAVARSVKKEDIEAVSSYNINEKDQFHPDEFTGYSEYRYYPNIFKEEKTGSIDGRYGSTLDLSEQTDWITGYTRATILAGKNTYYSYEISQTYMDAIYVDIFNTSSEYWFASRGVESSTMSITVSFGLFATRALNSTMYIMQMGMYFDDGSNQTNPYANYYDLRPVIEIDLDSVTIGEIGDGSKTSQYSIEAK